MWWSGWTLSLLVTVLLTSLPDVDSLQCFNCRGITDFDPQNCFNSEFGKTILQECKVNEMCEKKISQIDRLQKVIERGCSSNCADRTFIWTPDFQVHCCDGNRCNSAVSAHISLFTPLLGLLWLMF